MILSIPDFSKARILVVGDVILDQYWSGDAARISPEAPVPVMHVKQKENRLGGAANVAVNIASLGGQALLIGLVGEDHSAEEMEQRLTLKHIRHQLIHVPEFHTITKLRVLSHHQQLIRLDFEKDFLVEQAEKIIPLFEKALDQCDLVVLSDYGKGTLQSSRELIALAQKKNKPVFVDPKRLDFSYYQGATLITPNLKEFEAAVGGVCASEEEMAQKAYQLIEQCQFAALLVTRGEHGMTLFSREKEATHIPTRAREVFDVSGAGDTAIAVLAVSVAAGQELPKAMQLANLAAGIVVGKVGTASVGLHELQRAANHFYRGGVMTEKTLKLAVENARAHEETLVMTNGCFDVLHPGHVRYLEQAKQLGDRLIVAVNDDESVRHLKGAGRPINPVDDRMQVLAGLSAVDWVVPFSEDTPERIISEILPDVLVKGGDWTVDQIAGARAVLENKGQVKVLDFVEGKSSTAMIDRMKKVQKER